MLEKVRAAIVEVVDDLAEWSWDTVGERPDIGPAVRALADAWEIDVKKIIDERCKEF